MRAHALQAAANERVRALARDGSPVSPGRRSGHPSRLTQARAVAVLPAWSRHRGQDSVVNDRTSSVLICDDRADVRQELSRIVRLRKQDPVHGLRDGDALVNAYEPGSTSQVLIGVHSASTVGSEAFDLLLATHPTASPIVVGSVTDIDLLADVYARGAAGLLLWEPGKPLYANIIG